MNDARIFAICPDDDTPCGGVRKIYRHVDVLNAGGFDAAVVHQKEGFRCTWFEHGTRTLHRSQANLRSGDVLLLSEVIGPRLPQLPADCRIVIFNQNAYYMFKGYGFDPADRNTPYLDPRVRAALVVSEDSRQYLSHVFPRLHVFRLRLAVNPALFFYDPSLKRPQLCFMPRKHADEALQVINILKFRGALDGFPIVAIHGVSEAKAAEIMRESLVFLSFGYPEGFPLPPLEAMVCGCLTIGYQGMGGVEYFDAEHAFPVATADVLGFAKTVEAVLADWRTDPHSLQEKAALAARWIREKYTPEQEACDILTAWSQIAQR